MSYELNIKRVSNGYVLTKNNQDNDLTYVECIQDNDEPMLSDNYQEMNTYEDLAWNVLEYFGLQNSKHKECRLVIKVVPKEKENE